MPIKQVGPNKQVEWIFYVNVSSSGKELDRQPDEQEVVAKVG